MIWLAQFNMRASINIIQHILNTLSSLINRSDREKRSSYAPMKGVRYDGIYRIEKCWQIAGKQVDFTLIYMIASLSGS